MKDKEDLMPMGYNCAGTEETFERILGDTAGQAALNNELFVYLEVGIAEGTTLLSVAHYLKTLNAVSNGRFQWTAIGVDINGGPFFNTHKFLTAAKGHNVELHTGSGHVIGGFGSKNIVVILANEGVHEFEIPKASIDFCVIDGCHGAPCVERDFLAIEHAIKPGGIVAFHDAMPEDQGGEPGTNGWQAHCKTGIGVFQAIKNLGLLDEHLYWEKKKP